MLGIDDLLLGTLVGGVGSGLITTAGQLYANQQNLKYQTKVNDINWQIAAQNNATQIDMANTAHQREIADLRAAGLNPVLSAGGSGAVTPNLTNMRGDSAQIDNPVAGLGNSAKALGRYISGLADAELEQRKADVVNTQATNRALARENYVADLDALNFELQNQAENQALSELTTKAWKDKHGVWHREFDPKSKYVKELKDGMMSEAKNRANSNWRNNLNAINQSINTGASLLRGIHGLKSPSKVKRVLTSKKAGQIITDYLYN